jgi:hypothetical protein
MSRMPARIPLYSRWTSRGEHVGSTSGRAVAGIDLGIDLDATNAASDAAVAGDAASSQDDGGVDAAKCRGYTVLDVSHLGDGRGGSSGDAVSAGHRIVADSSG